ncbi:hypothetical protein [Flavobacterium poyangense]|uniref:hypothetical protein n=1 Tax=Flavobacterium poyangense TaxID=2204302 RepID=UPI00141F813A|nr:hypothetical protein [Flavobacterium sp. JXAS1]
MVQLILRSLLFIVWFVSDFKENYPFTGTLKVREEYPGIVSGGKTENLLKALPKKGKVKGKKICCSSQRPQV